MTSAMTDEISIHALREEGDLIRNAGQLAPDGISIHALREEGDGTFHFHVTLSGQFLSTPSARRATEHGFPNENQNGYFYPRPPRGGRRIATVDGNVTVTFLSTPSARRATTPWAFLFC